MASQPDQWHHFIAGGAGGAVSALCTTPLDLLKTRLQSRDGHKRFANQANSHRLMTQTVFALRDILKTEGLRGLFRGLTPNLLGIAPARAVYLYTYESTKKLCEPIVGSGGILHMGSAALAGICTATVTNPIWLVKTRMQLQTVSQDTSGGYKSYWDCTKTVYKKEGFRSFYRGVTASYWGSAESALYFLVYERIKSYRREQLMKDHHESISEVRLGALEYIVLSSTSKLIASSATYPHEVIRTRMREVNATYHSSFTKCFAHVYRTEGWRALYSGMGAHLIRVVPNAAILFLTYESMMHWLNGT